MIWGGGLVGATVGAITAFAIAKNLPSLVDEDMRDQFTDYRDEHEETRPRSTDERIQERGRRPQKPDWHIEEDK
jgi:hypothetical protein